MAHEDVEVVERLLALLPAGSLKGLIGDESFKASATAMIRSDAEIRFVDAEGGALGDAVPEGRGIEGLLEGWREWLEAWEDFGYRFEGMVDAGDGRVLSLAELSARTREGLEISHPGAALIDVRNGQIAAIRFYLDRDQARRDAGLG